MNFYEGSIILLGWNFLIVLVGVLAVLISSTTTSFMDLRIVENKLKEAMLLYQTVETTTYKSDFTLPHANFAKSLLLKYGSSISPPFSINIKCTFSLI